MKVFHSLPARFLLIFSAQFAFTADEKGETPPLAPPFEAQIAGEQTGGNDPVTSENRVPDVVIAAFEEKYPDSEPHKWEIDANGYWEAEFKKDGKNYRADFAKRGIWIETELSIEFEELPEPIQEAIREKYPDEEINEIESVDNAAKGKFFDVEFNRPGPNKDVEFRKDGLEVSPIDNVISQLHQPIIELSGPQVTVGEMGRLELMMEFGFNLLSIFLYAFVIYYRRHHDHKMLFLLLGFNLFLFPIFLLSSTLTAGFGFTIFALLALVRLRSDTFSKAEVAYLLGAVSLTFINAMMPARIEIISTVIVLLTAWLGDHPSIWRSAFQTANIRYRMKDTTNMLNQDFLRKQIAEDFQVEVNNLEIERVDKNEVRLVVMYRDLPEIREARRKAAKGNKRWRKKQED